MIVNFGQLANDGSKIYPFNGYGLSLEAEEDALFQAVSELKQGEILRLSIDKNPFVLIRSLVVKYGSKLIFEYLQNREGDVIIDFKRVKE
jgi:uncharacterized protein (DUF2249 family)